MQNIIELYDDRARSNMDLMPGSIILARDVKDEELAKFHEIGIPEELLVHVLDSDERSRVLKRDGIVYLVIHMPYHRNNSSEVPYATAPVSVFLLPEYIVVIEPTEMRLIQEIKEIPLSGMTANDKACFVLNMFLLAASYYLRYLREINLAVDDVEDRLQRSLRNREVLQLLSYQKSLVYFSTALNSIESIVEKLIKGDYLQLSVENKDLAENAIVEIRQAVYQVDIAQNILTSMMDAFASIVSNNLNTVMKFLAAVTIIISIPTLIASIYGMNVPLPGESAAQSFLYLIGISVLFSTLVIVVFRRMDWL